MPTCVSPVNSHARHRVRYSQQLPEARLLRQGLALITASIDAAAKADADSAKPQAAEADKLLAMDWGPDIAWASLQGTCFDTKVDKYSYKLCLFKDAKQGGILLGKWGHWSSGYGTMMMGDGAPCAGRGRRAAEVRVQCGVSTRLRSAQEPEMCR
jgi:protein kinase C substrate 80K-H